MKNRRQANTRKIHRFFFRTAYDRKWKINWALIWIKYIKKSSVTSMRLHFMWMLNVCCVFSILFIHFSLQVPMYLTGCITLMFAAFVFLFFFFARILIFIQATILSLESCIHSSAHCTKLPELETFNLTLLKCKSKCIGMWGHLQAKHTFTFFFDKRLYQKTININWILKLYLPVFRMYGMFYLVSNATVFYIVIAVVRYCFIFRFHFCNQVPLFVSR